jgi:hypothetical protein
MRLLYQFNAIGGGKVAGTASTKQQTFCKQRRRKIRAIVYIKYVNIFRSVAFGINDR